MDGLMADAADDLALLGRHGVAALGTGVEEALRPVEVGLLRAGP